jgi:polyisoprenoid-binding protein YceI
VRTERLMATLGLLAVLGRPPSAAGETRFVVDPEVGNNAFTAVFDSAIGERITAVSSAVGCTFTVDEAKLEGRGHCTVPLGSTRVDNDDTKTEHFGQWATNKKMEPAECAFSLKVPAVKLPPPLEAKKPVAFSTEGTFTICGRARDDHRPERIQGTVIYLPPGTYGAKRTLRIRARIEQFDREKYGVSPGTPLAGSRGCSSWRTSSAPRGRSM